MSVNVCGFRVARLFRNGSEIIEIKLLTINFSINLIVTIFVPGSLSSMLKLDLKHKNFSFVIYNNL